MKKRILVSTGLLIVVGVTAAALSLGKPSTNANAEPNTAKTQLAQSNPAATQEQLPPAAPVNTPATPTASTTQATVVQPKPAASTAPAAATTEPETKPLQEIPTVTGCTNSIPQHCFPGPTPADPPGLTPEDPTPVSCTNSIPQSCLYSDGSTRTQQSF